MDQVAKPLRVLLVDDDDSTYELLKIAFEADQRFTLVGRAANGRDGVVLAAALSPHLTLMDLHMPVMDGIEATRQIVASDRDACVIGFTSSADSEELAAMRAAGAVAIIPKPFDPFAVLDAVARHSAACAARAA